MRTIALEEHFVTQNFLKEVGGMPPQMRAMQEKLLDMGEGRIAAMDEAEIDLQVLSLASNGFDRLDAATGTALARDTNDELADAVKSRPSRFAGFAALCMKDPEQAANELERCVRELGFVGAMLDGTTDGLFLDQPQFLPVFEAAQALDVPVYLHPSAPPAPVMEAYFSGLPDPAGMLLSIAGWGWHSETALHTLRLIVSGVFERLPRLKLIIGHMGEGLPYALARSSKVLEIVTRNQSRTVWESFHESVTITTSGYFTLPPLRCALEVAGLERTMFSIDYPFSANTLGREYLGEIETSGLLSAADLVSFASGNAERILGLRPAASAM